MAVWLPQANAATLQMLLSLPGVARSMIAYITILFCRRKSPGVEGTWSCDSIDLVAGQYKVCKSTVWKCLGGVPCCWERTALITVCDPSVCTIKGLSGSGWCSVGAEVKWDFKPLNDYNAEDVEISQAPPCLSMQVSGHQWCWNLWWIICKSWQTPGNAVVLLLWPVEICPHLAVVHGHTFRADHID